MGQRWGRTGTAGMCKLQGPIDVAKVASVLAKIFKSKTGYVWGSIAPGHAAKAGKYWMMNLSQGKRGAKWEYYVGDGVDGKKKGWYPYDASAAQEVEDVYAEYKSN